MRDSASLVAVLCFSTQTTALSALGGGSSAATGGGTSAQRQRRAPRLAAGGSLEVLQLSEQELGAMGLSGNTDNIWLPTHVTSPLTERLPQKATRYVAEGVGKVSVGSDVYSVGPKALVTVCSGPADIVWTPDAGCDELLLLTSEYWSPARVAVRSALPAVWGVLGVLGAVATFSAVQSGV